MKANPSLVPPHLQFQVVLSEGVVLLIPAHTCREGQGSGLGPVCVCRTLSHRGALKQESCGILRQLFPLKADD